ncbi:hypothetical protein TDB9533_00981 [Thalassocella blandensis]|nr:hypothetical protein TDB9533_00981 [Thalassocella blandensis]
MTWSLISYNHLVHTSGATLRLVGGTWRNPQRIMPANVEGLTDYEVQSLVAEGLHYVKLNISELELDLLKKLEAKKSGNSRRVANLNGDRGFGDENGFRKNSNEKLSSIS